MSELFQDLDLTPKTLLPDERRHFGSQNLHRDSGLKLQIVSEQDVGRGTSTDQRMERVSFRQTLGEALNPANLWRKSLPPDHRGTFGVGRPVK